jgi:hypothetical protein
MLRGTRRKSDSDMPAESYQRVRLTSVSMWLNLLFFAHLSDDPVWCMPSEMVNGLRVTSPLKKNQESFF